MHLSLRQRLTLGAGALAVAALLAAALAVWGVLQTRWHLDAAVAAERRIDRMAGLAAQVTGYGLLSIEANRSGMPESLRARLDAQRREIEAGFAQLEAAYRGAIDAMDPAGLDARTAVATRAMGVTQMRAGFAGLVSRAEGGGIGPGDLELFAGSFGPFLNATREEEYRTRQAAFDAIEDLRRRLTGAEAAIAAGVLALFLAFLAGAVHPVFVRLRTLLGAARAIAGADLRPALPEGVRDEFGPLFAAMRDLADGLARREEDVARDRARLSEIVAARTASLEAANARLAAVDADRQRFFADVSHELRTPLAVILAEVELAGRGGTAAPAFGVIEARARRLMRRIEDLLRIARSASGRLDLQPVPVDLGDLAAAALAEAAPAIAQARVAAHLDRQAPVPALADPDWTRQVIESLIDNALRHGRGGGRLALVAGAEDGAAVLRIVDAGPGLEPGADPFVRFARGRRSEGFGIGLALARWIVEAQGGRIGAESPSPAALRPEGGGPGTTVTLRLPAPAAPR